MSDTGQANVTINYKTNAQRYNITFINSESGLGINSSSSCGETYMSADQLAGNHSQVATINFKCTDSNGDGTVDVATVFNWDERSGITYVEPTTTANVDPPKCASQGFVPLTGVSVPAALTIAKSNPSPSLKVGVESTYSLTVANPGGSAVDAEVQDLVPEGFINVGWSTTASGWSCSYDDASRLLTCTKTGLAASASEVIEVTATPTGVNSGQEVTN